MFTVGSFKGHATISLQRDEQDRFAFTFGFGKAKLILENLEAIQSFVAEENAKAVLAQGDKLLKKVA
jgi:hypothetical protein